ncbi:MAG: hypothetical protein BWY82_01915 [Verrucomicrobia bacterium ADurb.Bin474]|nr:MAG: hypothetical protein BWY82_01915 [Verrucomicrobia bacterium ADurb.Bin474]
MSVPILRIQVQFHIPLQCSSIDPDLGILEIRALQMIPHPRINNLQRLTRLKRQIAVIKILMQPNLLYNPFRNRKTPIQPFQLCNTCSQLTT